MGRKSGSGIKKTLQKTTKEQKVEKQKKGNQLNTKCNHITYIILHCESISTIIFAPYGKRSNKFQAIISHCKEYGFIFPSSEIYDGLQAVYDYGQWGSELKKNIRDYWWKSMTRMHENIVGIDAAIFMHPTTWKASGHVDNFNDPMIDNKDSKKDTGLII